MIKIYETGYKTGMIVTEKVILEINMYPPDHVNLFFNPADAPYSLKYRAKELNPKSKEYQFILDKHKELLGLMDIKYEE